MHNEMEREYHPAANLFPLLNGDDYESLKADIQQNGLLEAIWLTPDGRILDGRNRHRACIDLGIAPSFRTYQGDSPVSFVVSLNLHRRHLTSSQLAFVGRDMLPMLEEEAAARQIALAGTRPNSSDLSAILHEGVKPGRSDEKAAAVVGVSARYIADAKAIDEKDKALAERVRAGEMTIPQAKRLINKSQQVDAPPLPDGKYRVIYADPPWQYQEHGATVDPSYGGTGWHYPSMSIEQLCELPVKDLAARDSVLFIWVTSPKLNEVWAIIDAWGFQYKTSFVWDKVKHNFGYYNSVRHELLLVAGRGSSTPDNTELFDSVQTIERTERHSEKPEQFRRIIDTLYPEAKKIELFARRPTAGWDTWGNEGAASE